MDFELRYSDERPCLVKWKDEWTEAILHLSLCRSDMAKVELPTGELKDFGWWNVRITDSEDRLDAIFGVDGDE